MRERLSAYLGRLALRVRPVDDADFMEWLEVAFEEGRISEEQMDDAKRINAVARGRRRNDGETIYLTRETQRLGEVDAPLSLYYTFAIHKG